MRELLSSSLFLVAGVVLGSGFLGTGLACLITLCEFPGRRFFVWALLLPMSLPAYVLAFVIIGLFDSGGLAHTAWRSWLGDHVWFPNVRSGFGLILSLTLSHYPYVYLSARKLFHNRFWAAMGAARSLGASSFGAIFRVAMPMAIPWIGAGLALVVMETLGDLGAVSLFHYETFTTAIYKAWSGPSSLLTAILPAGTLMLLAFVVLLMEQRLRTRQCNYQSDPSDGFPRRTLRLRGLSGFCACSCVTLVLSVAFIIPLGLLLIWSLESLADGMGKRFGDYVLHSLLLAGVGAFLIMAAALVLSVSKRHRPGAISAVMVRIATLGYSLPGAALALGFAISASNLDNLLIDVVQTRFDSRISPVLGSGLSVMSMAILVRFLATGFGAIDRSMLRFTRNLEDAARSLGVHGLALFQQVQFPLLRNGLLGACLLVFAEIMKEMPITALTRPHGFDTLSVGILEMAAKGDWQSAALPSVALVLTGLLPIILLVRGMENRYV